MRCCTQDRDNGKVITKGQKDKNALFEWKETYRIESVLVAIKNMFMKPDYRKLAQPPDGQTYP